MKEKIMEKLALSISRDSEKYLITPSDITKYFYEETNKGEQILGPKYDLVITANPKDDLVYFDIDKKIYYFNIAKFNSNHKNNIISDYETNTSYYNVELLEQINKIIAEVKLRKQITNGLMNAFDPKIYVLLINDTMEYIVNPKKGCPIMDFYTKNMSKIMTSNLIRETYKTIGFDSMVEQFYRSYYDSYVVSMLRQDNEALIDYDKNVRNNLRRALGRRENWIISEVFGPNTKEKYNKALYQIKYCDTYGMITEEFVDNKSEEDIYELVDESPIINKYIFGKRFNDYDYEEMDTYYDPKKSLFEVMNDIHEQTIKANLRK